MTLQAELRTAVTYAVGMAAAVCLLLWAAIGLVGPKTTVSAPETMAPAPKMKAPAIVATTEAIRPNLPNETPAVAAPPPIVAGLSGLPADTNALVGQMQRALTQKGYRVGSDNDPDADTVAALQAFQDANALTVQPTCNQQCWNALGLPDPK